MKGIDALEGDSFIIGLGGRRKRLSLGHSLTERRSQPAFDLLFGSVPCGFEPTWSLSPN
jgi:hypothetical protein